MTNEDMTYIAFDGDTDLNYYNMLKAWKENDEIDFDFNDAHDLNTASDSSLTESIKRQLRPRFDDSKIFMILVGQNTKFNRKFIPWEIKQALKRKMPIIVVNLNNKRRKSDDICPTLLRDELAIHIPFKARILQYTIENWPYFHKHHEKQGYSGACFYEDSLYDSLGL